MTPQPILDFLISTVQTDPRQITRHHLPRTRIRTPSHKLLFMLKAELLLRLIAKTSSLSPSEVIYFKVSWILGADLHSRIPKNTTFLSLDTGVSDNASILILENNQRRSYVAFSLTWLEALNHL